MDLLRNAYSTTADDDDDDEHEKHASPPFKRAKPDFLRTESRHFPAVSVDQSRNVSNEVPIAGRYISKRERALMAATPQTSNADPPTSSTFPPGLFS